MAYVKAVTGAAEDDFVPLKDAAKRLGTTSEFSASRVAGAMSYFKLAGFDADRIPGTIFPALNMQLSGKSKSLRP